MVAGVISAALVGGYAAAGGGGGEITISVSDPTGGEHDTGDTGTYNIGTRFQVSAAATLRKVRLYRPASDTARTARLWDNAGGTSIADLSIGSESAAGWYEYAFGSPPSLTASVNYVISFTKTGAGQTYYVRANFFAGASTNGILTLPADAGSGRSTGNGLFFAGDDENNNPPDSSFNKSFYFVLPVVQAS
jgi:hypothetical protein